MPSVLLIGGMRSGKSSGAMHLVLDSTTPSHRVAVIVFGIPGIDSEFDERIARHQSDRPDTWDTIEVSCGDNWVPRVADYDAVIVDCVGTMLSQFIVSEVPLGTELSTPSQENVANWAIAQFDVLLSSPARVVIVTNEVGLGLVSEYPAGRVFTDAVGRVNQWLTQKCDRTYCYIAGVPVDLRKVEARPEWPA